MGFVYGPARGIRFPYPLKSSHVNEERPMHQLNELLDKKITRRRFPIAFGAGLAAMIGLVRLADSFSEEKPATDEEQLPATPNYGAWRPRTAGVPTMPTV